ncbi:hypothetical protein [Vannielia litorea]|uniref:hypothetical protein n=1 Tax=Vannielia litorea TaxID=1217970 RepID=UPI001BCAE481|nr:hypothetical protein [Vannielia litorea]MBS8226704.1 hypothetical protein [Vannielia litorea]
MAEEADLKTVGFGALLSSDIYKDICSRFHDRHHINLPSHISAVKSLGKTYGVGFKFQPRDADLFEAALKRAAFEHDNRRHFCDAVAAGATQGEGYREIGVPSLHVAVSSGICSVHIDTFGFVALGPDGEKIYTPDALQHVIDELLWQDVILGKVAEYSPLAANALRRVHFVGPSSQNNYRPQVGARLNLVDRPGLRLGLEVTRDLSGETRGGASLEVMTF